MTNRKSKQKMQKNKILLTIFFVEAGPASKSVHTPETNYVLWITIYTSKYVGHLL